jgi:hypothetical protein
MPGRYCTCRAEFSQRWAFLAPFLSALELGAAGLGNFAHVQRLL